MARLNSSSGDSLDKAPEDFGSLEIIKEEPLFKTEDESVCSNIFHSKSDSIVYVKEEMQYLDKDTMEIIKAELPLENEDDSMGSDVECPFFFEGMTSNEEFILPHNDHLDSSSTTTFRTKREENGMSTPERDVTHLGVMTKDECQNEHLSQLKCKKSTSCFKRDRKAYVSDPQNQLVLTPCSVILEDCMKMRENTFPTSKNLSDNTEVRSLELLRETNIFSKEKGILLFSKNMGRFKCKECDAEFAFNSHFIQHLRAHTGEKPFECKECGKRFTRKSSLKLHHRTHTGDKPFECKVCCKRFTQIIGLQAHHRRHTREKPFECRECCKSFTQKVGLQVHLRYHTGERPFKCKECCKSFTQKVGLQTHLRLHTGEKPFECKECCKKFTQKVGLQAHLRHHTYP